LSKKSEFFSKIDGKEVKVLNKVYKVKVKKVIREGELYGLTNHDRGQIRLLRDQPLSSAKDTLLHEVLHAIWHGHSMSYGIQNEEAEEYAVTMMATGIMAVMEDNPWLREALFKEEYNGIED
jgi:Zn-dependent peptidase ImmA (M78 family)